MPLDGQQGWDRAAVISAADVLELLGTESTLTPSWKSAALSRRAVVAGPATARRT